MDPIAYLSLADNRKQAIADMRAWAKRGGWLPTCYLGHVQRHQCQQACLPSLVPYEYLQRMVVV